MRLNVVLRYVGIVMLFNAAFMVLSAGVSYFYDIDSGFQPLLLSAALTAVIGAFPLIFVGSNEQISNKEGYTIVVGAWLMSCVVGSFPYLLWGGEFGFIDAWFESVSGYTTTGATILNDVEALPKGLLFWRSLTHWMGGVGVVMFALVILPSLGRSKMTISNVELSSIAKDNYRYRANTIIRILLTVYLGITLCCTLLLRVAGMDFFDAINHAMSTVATGGFSTKNLSIAYYDNIWIEIVLTFFMVLSGIHFGLIFATFTGKYMNIFRSEVVRYYLLSLIIGCLAISVSIWLGGSYESFWSALRYSSFELATYATTTGFAVADSNLWSPFAITLLMIFSIQCGCAGSTSGGIKCDRVCIAAKAIWAKIRQQQHPNAIFRIKLGGVVQEKSVSDFVMLFIVLYLFLILVGTVVMTAAGLDLVTAFSTSIANLGNVGPGFGETGGFNSYANLPGFVRFFCPLLMLFGRLEIFGLLQLFLLKWWK